jgi:hypothetical protein
MPTPIKEISDLIGRVSNMSIAEMRVGNYKCTVNYGEYGQDAIISDNQLKIVYNCQEYRAFGYDLISPIIIEVDVPASLTNNIYNQLLEQVRERSRPTR